MTSAHRTPRERIERAFHVSFKLPEQAAQLIDDLEAEVRDQALAEAAAIVHNLPPATATGDDQHWYRFGQNRAADAILNARTSKEPK
ncbi:hypothetical protein OG689_10715 [Kitasatospora sp. NBC_00240]|uniref:hypothetical protein n=1 Tax=Kitasatospora sp. NBC_00240 TaxID=2903567 RepID=UPI002253D478|nr:hypothetical protein [Kitasatospora sp. NBC_00240]MCX5209755.1 hypothetical protein [Kitasatospora sp. NBC_00240]